LMPLINTEDADRLKKEAVLCHVEFRSPRGWPMVCRGQGLHARTCGVAERQENCEMRLKFNRFCDLA
jgi:hypothetical protein